jgi:hypothetical protein
MRKADRNPRTEIPKSEPRVSTTIDNYTRKKKSRSDFDLADTSIIARPLARNKARGSRNMPITKVGKQTTLVPSSESKF